MSSSPHHAGDQEMWSEVQLPCGRMLRNRLVKAAMYEHLAPLFGGPPNELHYALYSRWARGGWGMIITGNVQVSIHDIGLGRDVTVPRTFDKHSLQPYKIWASILRGEGSSDSKPLTVMQLCHPGRQSPNTLGGRWPGVPPQAPSAVPIGPKSTSGTSTSLLGFVAQKMLFQTPREMTIRDIDCVVEQFVKASRMASEAGFDGVQIHAAHGYLITQFMSQKTNLRTDEYSAKTNPLLLLHRIINSIRAPGVVPKDFVLGVKLNAADYVDTDAGLVSSEDRALRHLQVIANWGLVDFIEISGGDYDDPNFLWSATSSPRQAVFEGFSKRAMNALTTGGVNSPNRPLIMLTGGLRSPELMRSALSHKHTDLLGIGRFSVLCPELPNALSKDPTASFPSVFPLMKPEALAVLPWKYYLESRLASVIISSWNAIPAILRPEIPGVIGAGAVTARYAVLMRALARGQEEAFYAGDDIAVVMRFWWYIAPGPWHISMWTAILAGLIAVAFTVSL